MNNQQTWTEEIKSQNTLFSINFMEVWHYRDLLLVHKRVSKITKKF